MKIRSEYALLAECIESGIALGYNRAYKHVDNPSEDVMKQQIYNAVMTEIVEWFVFDQEPIDPI